MQENAGKQGVEIFFLWKGKWMKNKLFEQGWGSIKSIDAKKATENHNN